MNKVTPDVPTSLRVCFLVHFALDIVLAVPLLLFPVTFLNSVGWSYSIDPVTARLVAAALLGIGIESLIGSRRTIESFVAMLNPKIIWSFFALWVYWRFRLR